MRHNPYIKEDVDSFFQANMGLVHTICNRYRRWLDTNRQYVDYDDMQQAGSIGLIHAYEHFDPQNGRYQFSTYALLCIRGYILRFIRDHNPGPRFSNGAKSLCTKIVKKDLQDEPHHVIAIRLGTTVSMVALALRFKQHSKILPLDTQKHKQPKKIIKYSHATNIYDKQVILNDFLATLGDREKAIAVLMCKGYNGAEIGSILGITRSYVSLIFLALLKKAEKYSSEGEAAL